MACQQYGANITTRQFAGICITLCLGTAIEWYDFAVYSQLSDVLVALFFLAPTGQLSALVSFWAVYAIGFIARPIGAVLFGHVGDAYGRRPALVSSMALTMLATVCIGCLPTYSQAGVAAPVLLTVLRAVQGIAVGGQFGTAVVYLHEVAAPGSKGTFASLVQQAVGPGIILGMLACLAVTRFCSADQLLVWGWRVPFLLAALAAPLAIVLRMQLQEPHEYSLSQRRMVLHRIADTAARQVARKHVMRKPKTSSPTSAQQVAAQLQAATTLVWSPVISPRNSTTASETDERETSHLQTVCPTVLSSRMVSHGGALGTAAAATAAAAELDRWSLGGHHPHQQQPRHQSVSAEPSVTTTERIRFENSRFCQELSRRLEQYSRQCGSYNSQCSRQYSSPGQASSRQYSLPGQQATKQCKRYEQKLFIMDSKEVKHLGCEAEYVAYMESLGKKIRRHVPLLLLLKAHWQQLWLQVFLEGLSATSFYLFFSWFPTYLRASATLPPQTIHWAVMAGMGVYTVLTPYGGWLTDNGPPAGFIVMGVTLCVSAVSIPVMFALHNGQLILVSIMVPAMLGACGLMGGLLASIGPQIYPAEIRVCGYGIGHSLGMSIWGGLTPFMISVLTMIVQPSALAAGILLVILGILAWSAVLGLISNVPHLKSREVVRQRKASAEGVNGGEQTDVAAAEAAAEQLQHQGDHIALQQLPR